MTVFRARLRPEALAEYREWAARTEALARAMPGFADFKTFVAADPAQDVEQVSIVVFDSLEAHQAWRDHPDHRRAQGLGRQRFYESYSIHVCQEVAHRGRRAGEVSTPAPPPPP